MYKVTLYDYNCVSCTSGVAEFFADDINKFQESWFKLEDDEDRKKRFLKSLNGEMITDYYSDSPDLNIVQEDKDAKILKTDKLCFANKKFTLINGYGCTGDIEVLNAEFLIRHIKFQNDFLIVGKYRLSGVARVDSFIQGFRQQYVYGNCVLKTQYHSYVEFERGKPLYNVRDFSNFKDDVIESICYIPVKWFDSLEEMQGYILTQEDLVMLMRDILGEAG
ncbi:MAG: hypothetical protein K2M91_02170 [Lachnospiraceae bacterium]|nr:hypothetical protein [Lachnospiraceae bacterium]